MPSQVRTSATHPLYVSEVQVPGAGGKIGMTLFPGRRDKLSAFGWWERDIRADLDELRKWNPALIITLVERHEYATSGVPQFEKEMKAFAARENVVWEQAPISDGGVPDAAFEKVWLETGRTARMALRAGCNVLLHCRAGLARTE